MGNFFEVTTEKFNVDKVTVNKQVRSSSKCNTKQQQTW